MKTYRFHTKRTREHGKIMKVEVLPTNSGPDFLPSSRWPGRVMASFMDAAQSILYNALDGPQSRKLYPELANDLMDEYYKKSTDLHWNGVIERTEWQIHVWAQDAHGRVNRMTPKIKNEAAGLVCETSRPAQLLTA